MSGEEVVRRFGFRAYLNAIAEAVVGGGHLTPEAFYAVLIECLPENCDEETYEIVSDVCDRLCGWTHPDQQICPPA